MRDRDIYILDQFLPVFGRLRRLFPNEEGKQRRLMSTWMSTMLGGGLRTNDPTEKRSQWFKMQREFQADVQDRVDIQTRRV
jgi:hypothetical protein